MQVVAAVDVDADLAKATAAAIGAGRFSTDYREVLPDADAVLLALPHHLHHPIGKECLEAGVHVLMEKPLANTEEECLDLIAAADKSGATLMTAYCMRFHLLVEKNAGADRKPDVWRDFSRRDLDRADDAFS